MITINILLGVKLLSIDKIAPDKLKNNNPYIVTTGNTPMIHIPRNNFEQMSINLNIEINQCGPNMYINVSFNKHDRNGPGLQNSENFC